MNQTSYEKFSIATLEARIVADEVVLPRYQRDVVWDEERKQKLIDSIRKGFPIGSLLLAEVDVIMSSVSRKVLKIIDGLQRTSTLLEYLQHPERFINPDWVLSEWIAQTVKIVEVASQPVPSDDLISTVLHQFLLKEKSRRDSLSLVNEFAKGFSQPVSAYTEVIDDIQDSFAALIESINTSLDISSVEVPYIKFVGSLEDQAEAFVRLNTYSVSLDKYEVAAGHWSHTCELTNPDVQQKVKDYWKKRLENISLEIEGIQPDGTPDEYLLYDVLVGLGLSLRQKFPLLIEDNDVIAQSIGFQIAAIAQGLRLNQITDIEGKFGKMASGENLDVDDFIASVFMATEVLNDALYPVLGMKLTSTTIKSQFQDHTVYQVCSLIVAILMEARDSDGTWTKSIAKRTPAQSKMLQAWYLLDRLKREWGNAGDSKLFNRIWKQAAPGSSASHDLNDFYAAMPSKSLVDLQLESWFGDELEKKHSKRQLISSETKLILRYFYSAKVSFAHHYSKEFQLDHLVPLSWWKTLFQEIDPNAAGPINCIGILSLMPKEDHDTKGTMLPADWYREVVQPGGSAFEQRCLDDYFLIDPDHFGFAEPISKLKSDRRINSTELEKIQEEYVATCKSRWSEIKLGVTQTLFG